MELVGLISAYLEGPLVDGAIRSALAGCDHVLVFEGPAGPPLEADVPETDYAKWEPRIWLKEGRWRTDAHKRTAMVEACRRFEPPVWGCWIDGDEVLVNAEYLRDWVQMIQWDEEAQGTDDILGWPIKKIELDGSVAIGRGRVVRVDRIDSYSISSSVFKNALGFLEGQGDHPLRVSELEAPYIEWIERTRKTDPASAEVLADTLRLLPPIPTEPFILHRSALRHPARRGLRLHEQEREELRKAVAELNEAGLAAPD